jgi:hypothetical protein
LEVLTVNTILVEDDLEVLVGGHDEDGEDVVKGCLKGVGCL